MAISAVERACSLTDKVFRNLVTADTVTKKDKSPVTVGDYSAQAVVNAILEQEQSILTPDNIDVAKTLADAVCQFLADSTVSEVLLGGPVP